MTQEPFTPRAAHPHDIVIPVGTAEGRRKVAAWFFAGNTALLAVAFVGSALAIPCDPAQYPDERGEQEAADRAEQGKRLSFGSRLWARINNQKCDPNDGEAEVSHAARGNKNERQPAPLLGALNSELTQAHHNTEQEREGGGNFHAPILTSRGGEST